MNEDGVHKCGRGGFDDAEETGDAILCLRHENEGNEAVVT